MINSAYLEPMKGSRAVLPLTTCRHPSYILLLPAGRSFPGGLPYKIGGAVAGGPGDPERLGGPACPIAPGAPLFPGAPDGPVAPSAPARFGKGTPLLINTNQTS